MSLSSIKTEEKIVFMHYPPLSPNLKDTVFTDLFKKYNVKKCYYGHLHGDAHNYKVDGEIDGIEYQLISSDYLDFKPHLVKFIT